MAQEPFISLNIDRSEPRYTKLAVAVAQAIDDADPIGLLKIGAPADEYSREIGTIIPRVVFADAQDEVVDILHQEFLRRFGEPTADSREAYVTVAARVWQAVLEYQSHSTDTGQSSSAPLFSAGDCPVCADSGAIIFLMSVSDRRLFFGCPLCGCAWAQAPAPFVLEAIDPPAVFAARGFRVANRDDINAAGLGGLIRKYHDGQSGLSFVGAEGYQE